jgi:hypothetical protein
VSTVTGANEIAIRHDSDAERTSPAVQSLDSSTNASPDRTGAAVIVNATAPALRTSIIAGSLRTGHLSETISLAETSSNVVFSPLV